MSETKTLWQRCEALGQFEDYKDDHIDMHFEDERWVIHHDGHPIAFIYEDRMQGSPWLADAILCYIERLRFGRHTMSPLEEMSDDEKAAFMKAMSEWTCGPMTFVPGESVVTKQNINEKLREAVDGGQYDHDTDGRHRDPNFNGVPLDSVPLPIPNKLPDVTYVVEAPKPTEPTQEQLKAIWDHVMHLTGEQAESYGFQYAVIGNAAQANFELHIKSLGSRFGEWQIKIMHGHIGRYWWENPFDLVTTARLINMAITIPTEQYVTESPLQFVSIPVQDWQAVLEAFMSLGKVLNSHTA